MNICSNFVITHFSFCYQAHFKKVYGTLEDRFRHNIYFANKEKQAKYEELHRLGLPVKKLDLDVFADFTCDELKLPEESQTEWDNYKVSLYSKCLECNKTSQAK